MPTPPMPPSRPQTSLGSRALLHHTDQPVPAKSEGARPSREAGLGGLGGGGMGPQARSVAHASRLGSSAASPRLGHLCPQGEPRSLARGEQLGASRTWTRHRQAWGRGAPEGSGGQGLCRGVGESQARSQTTLHPEAHRRLHRASIPCGLRPSAAPLWQPRRDPPRPQHIHSSGQPAGPGDSRRGQGVGS